MAIRKRAGSKTTPASNKEGFGKDPPPRNTRPRSSAKSRKAGSKNPPAKKSKLLPFLFWLGFVLVFFILFLVNRESISESVQAVQNEIALNRNAAEGEPAQTQDEGRSSLGETPPSSQPAAPLPAGQGRPQNESSPVPQAPTAPQQAPAASASQSPAPAQQAAPSATQPSAQTPAQPASQNTQGQSAQAPATQSQQSAQSPQASATAELRDRVLYFIFVDRGGSILREKVTRKIPASESPMSDALTALLAGPNGEEKTKGLISLIPPNTQLLSATVRGDTAYLSFSEDFMYNTYGVEGYAGQLRQIIFTTTEFSNVKNVQILVEGRRIDYLGEGIWIGSPLNRDMI